MNISAHGPDRARRCRQSLDRASVAQFSVSGESEVSSMWTTGRPSKLTGIPARTLQEWSKRPDTNMRGKASGSGILPAETNEKNGYRLFDRNSLYDILIIKLAKEAGLRDTWIRGVTANGKRRPMSDPYIEYLLRERREIDRKIEIARAISFVERTKIFSLRADCDAEGAYGLEGLIASELIDRIAAHLSEFDREKRDEADRLVDDSSWHAGIETLERLWQSGESPAGASAMKAVEALRRSLHGIPYAISTEVFCSVATEWASKGYARLALALRTDEGFLEFFEQAVSSYGAETQARESGRGETEGRAATEADL